MLIRCKAWAFFFTSAAISCLWIDQVQVLVSFSATSKAKGHAVHCCDIFTWFSINRNCFLLVLWIFKGVGIRARPVPVKGGISTFAIRANKPHVYDQFTLPVLNEALKVGEGLLLTLRWLEIIAEGADVKSKSHERWHKQEEAYKPLEAPEAASWLLEFTELFIDVTLAQSHF